ncbi:putative aldehyde reductase protein [Botrytis fragariae]|uniref:Putative aldehyde reductase protein n=1 Tax=Botrytis fragariae TaxID=1964551 RepID=A0A8H6AY68_9HELO|nr:putative aldehyde reductase protein [Botrytis fragariae]KAF5875692.1 putative aldehyde reductase protein [Botrytis fragariae]
MSPAIPKDSTVLVTGINGYIGSHVADQLLKAGYRVRGTTRDASKMKNLLDLWEEQYGKNRVEVAVVPNMAEDGAFDEAVKGVTGIAHVASNMSFSPNPNDVIPECLAGVNGLLESAASEPSVKRFVITSSSMATTSPKPNKEFYIDENTWNDEDVEAAHAPPPYEPSRTWAVYGSSKVESERAVWNFVKEKKPGFVANSVLPDTNMGLILDPAQGSTGGLVRKLFLGDNSGLKNLPPQYFIDVQDTARLHVSALIDEDVKNERLFAFAEPFNNNILLRTFRKIRPDAKIMDDFHDDSVNDLSKVANQRAAELLRRDFGRAGFTSLEESLANNIQGL